MVKLADKIKERLEEEINEQAKERLRNSTLWNKLKNSIFRLEPFLRPRPLNRLSIIKKKSEEHREQIERKRRHLLKRSLMRAGVKAKPEIISRWVFRTAVLMNILVGLFLVIRYATYFKFAGVVYVPILLIAIWFATFVFVFFLLWLVLYVTFDFLSYRRRVGIEDVLPDFLLLASANIRSGMPIDQALWYAVRPRFGVLAKEIEFVAKETMSGEDLEVALQKFADKYNSLVLKNTVNLIIEGINAGGEIGQLLHNISVDIQESKRLKKDMAASISTYAIFIGVSALIIAPIMFALSSQLLVIISEITSGIDVPEGLESFAFSSGGISISQGDFLKFAYTNLFFTSLISAMLVSIIRKGEIKAGLRYIPIFIGVSLLVFYLANRAFSGVFGGLLL